MFLVPTMPVAGRFHGRRSTLAVDLSQGMQCTRPPQASDRKVALSRDRDENCAARSLQARAGWTEAGLPHQARHVVRQFGLTLAWLRRGFGFPLLDAQLLTHGIRHIR